MFIKNGKKTQHIFQFMSKKVSHWKAKIKELQGLENRCFTCPKV